GPEFDHSDATGNPTNIPPPIRSVIKTLVPRVDADGNELGGVPTVQRDAPLATYLGWNITAGPGHPFYDGRPFHAGQVCNYVGGMVPFFKTKAQRLAAGDTRLSLEERYGTHAGYVAAVKNAADNAACKGYLLGARKRRRTARCRNAPAPCRRASRTTGRCWWTRPSTATSATSRRMAASATPPRRSRSVVRGFVRARRRQRRRVVGDAGAGERHPAEGPLRPRVFARDPRARQARGEAARLHAAARAGRGTAPL